MARLRVLADGALPGAANMARDRDLLAAYRPGDDPVLRIYRWDPPAVTIGYNQQVDDFDADGVRAAGWDVVRRPTGGRAILHADELTYAVVGTSPGPLFGDSLHDVYLTINRALVAFLAGLGIAAEIAEGESRDEARGLVCFRSAGRYEIAVAGRKLVGSAQRRTGGCFLQHGSILAGPGHLELLRFLRPGKPGADVPARELALGTTDLGQLRGARYGPQELDALAPALAAAFAGTLGLAATAG
ncbi:MAG: lipoate--protein ligase family protein [Krumholzibacteria bacterium]|nr:lipoate--protein ligase family protein [Candidatus Krumholzibacteria bacterium]